MKIDRRFGVLVVAAIVGIAGTSALGFWQLRRAAAKELLQQQMDLAARAEPVTLDASAAAQVLHRRVRVTGHWMPDRAIYLDNRPNAGRAGFYVLMPMRLDGPVSADVVVNRGWIPRDAGDRARIAPYRTAAGAVTLTGVAIAEEPRLMELGSSGPHRVQTIWQNFDFDDFAQASGIAPLRFVVRQDPQPGVDDGLDRNWPDRSGGLQAQIDRHHGYAVQWFALAVTLAALMLYQFIRASRGPQRARATS